MKTLRELMNERPLKFRAPRPEWTMRIRNGVHGPRLLVVDADTGRTVTETGISRLEGAFVVEALHLAAEYEGTIPGLINCEQNPCLHSDAIELWAVHHDVSLRFQRRHIPWEVDPPSARNSVAGSSGMRARYPRVHASKTKMK